MAAPSLSALPARFNAGNTVKYTRRHSDYPASAGWTLALHIGGASSFSIAANANGDAFDVTIPAAQTATRSVTDAATTAASKVLGKGAGSYITDAVRTGDLVTGPGIPARVAYVDPAYPIAALSLTLSVAATATGTGLPVKFRFPPGIYHWTERVTLGAEVYDADEGTVSIDPDPAGAPGGVYQTWEQEMLPLVEAIVAGKIATDTAAYSIADRSKTALNFGDMLSFLGYLRAAVRGQANPGTLEKAYPVFGPRV